MGKTKKAQLAGSATKTGKDDAEELDGDGRGGWCQCNEEHAQKGEAAKAEDAEPVGDLVDKIGSDEFREESR